jgi:hypothetical protein
MLTLFLNFRSLAVGLAKKTYDDNTLRSALLIFPCQRKELLNLRGLHETVDDAEECLDEVGDAGVDSSRIPAWVTQRAIALTVVEEADAEGRVLWDCATDPLGKRKFLLLLGQHEVPDAVRNALLMILADGPVLTAALECAVRRLNLPLQLVV